MTWLDNYKKSSADAGVDLVANPDAMLDPVISARVLIRGLMDGRWNGARKDLDFYEGEDDLLSDGEATEARRTVNGKDRAAEIAKYFRQFYDALTQAGFGVIQPEAVVPVVVARPTTGTPVATHWLSTLIATLVSLFGGKNETRR